MQNSLMTWKLELIFKLSQPSGVELKELLGKVLSFFLQES